MEKEVHQGRESDRTVKGMQAGNQGGKRSAPGQGIRMDRKKTWPVGNWKGKKSCGQEF